MPNQTAIIRVGTRASMLAFAQFEEVKKYINNFYSILHYTDNPPYEKYCYEQTKNWGNTNNRKIIFYKKSCSL